MSILPTDQIRTSLATIATIFILTASISSAQAEQTFDGKTYELAREAYLYAYPIVLMDTTMRQATNVPNASTIALRAPINQFAHFRAYPDATTRDVVRFNFDTLYSFAWLDVAEEPVVLSVPDTDGRYYLVPMLDMWTDVFANVGARTTGTNAGSYAIVSPNWSGTLPGGVKKIVAPTSTIWIMGRTQTNGKEDFANVHKVQDGYRLTPLSQWGNNYTPPDNVSTDPAIDNETAPVFQVNTLDGMTMLTRLADLLQKHPPHANDYPLLSRISHLGIEPGKPFDTSRIAPEKRDAINAAAKDTLAEMAQTIKKGFGTHANGWAYAVEGIGTYGTAYKTRAAVALGGLGANPTEDSVYPVTFVDAGGAPLSGANRYVLHFEKGKFPPADAFWSVTLYDNESFQVPNPLDRYAIGDRDNLAFNADGSLDIAIQHEQPAAGEEQNWLPAPKGDFNLTMRIYSPRRDVLDGMWTPPAVKKILPSEAQTSARESSATPVTPVTFENFIRAESDLYLQRTAAGYGFGKIGHSRELAEIDNQTVIRLNRDTLYSAGVFDLDAGPVTISLPDAGARFISMQVINEDHDVVGVYYDAGPHTIDKETAGTRYVVAAFRILVDPKNFDDVAEVHALQNAIEVDQDSAGTLDFPKWDTVSQKKVRDALLTLASTMPDFRHAFGAKGQVDPVRHLIASAAAWGGNPDKDATYLNITPEHNDGKTVYTLNVRDVPVDGFWSVSVYNAEGYYEKNALDAYTLNNLTAKKEDDGTITIQFGDCDESNSNCLPTMPGWNYTVRLYRPHAEILDGSWKFPDPQPTSGNAAEGAGSGEGTDR